ncbi:MAG: ABC transporter substrate-binding protein [Acidimicrobiales bacterium]
MTPRHRTRRILTALVATTSIAAGAVAPGGVAAGTQPEGEPIRIGVNIEQTGPAAVQGEAYTRAVELLATQINDGGGVLGRPIELVVVDNQSDPTEAVNQTQALIDEGVVAMIGPGTSPTTLAAMDVILSSGVPTISMGSADAIVDPVAEHPNVFKTPARGLLMAEVIAADLAANDVTVVGLIAVNNPYGDSGVDAWEQLAEDGDVDLVGVERFEAADTDMSGQLNSLIDAGAEAIVTWAIPPGAPTVRRSAVENVGTDLPMYFDAGAGAELFIELAGAAADGARIVHPRTLIWDGVAEDHPQYEVLTEFGAAYTAEHGEMSGFAGYAWDALALFAAAIEAAGSTEPEAIVAALEGLGEYAGVTGVFEITAEDHQGLDADDLVILTVEDGEWRPVE